MCIIYFIELGRNNIVGITYRCENEKTDSPYKS